jgi:hypothetical protein
VPLTLWLALVAQGNLALEVVEAAQRCASHRAVQATTEAQASQEAMVAMQLVQQEQVVEAAAALFSEPSLAMCLEMSWSTLQAARVAMAHKAL